MAVFPSIFRTDDPFNRWMKRAAPLAILLLLPVFVLLHQFSRSLHGRTLATAPSYLVRSEEVRDPGVGGLAVVSKIQVKQVFAEMERLDPSGRSSQRPFGDVGHPERAQGASFPREKAQEALKSLEEMAITRTDRLRLAIVAGELLGPAEAASRLGVLEAEAEPDGSLAKDIGWLRPWYVKAAAGKLDPLPTDVQEAIRDRHGWFGDLAITHQISASDPLRWSVVSGVERLSTLLGWVTAWRALGFLFGLVVAVVSLVKMRHHSLAVMETSIDRSLYSETFALFLLGFVALDCVSLLVLGETGAWAFVVEQVMLWLAVGAIFWPLLRGATGEELRIDVGLTSGAGVGNEVAYGLLGYLACIPFTVLAMIIMAIFTGDSAGDVEVDGKKFPMFETPLSDSWVPVIFGAISTCLWAPVFEEIFFRGCIHRYLPFKLNIWVRILASAAIFGIVHPYDASGMVQVGMGGIVYGYLREWRGSIIAPMVAHFLHNASIMAVTLGVLIAVR